MDPKAAVKGETRFFRKKNQPGGWPPGGALPDREIPRPPPAPLPPIPAGRGAAGAGCFCACDAAGQDLFGSMMDPTGAGAGNAFSPKFSRRATQGRRGGGLTAGKSRMREELRRPFPTRGAGRAGEASSARATRGAPGASMMDPAPARGRDRAPPRSGCRRAAVRRPPLPRTGDSPCAPNAFAALAEAWGAERAIG